MDSNFNLALTYYLIKMKNIILVFFLISTNYFAFGQEKKVNNYKFIIVPERFDFLKQNDEYQTSSLTKFLLKQNGFTVVLGADQYPAELREDPCSALTAFVIDKSSMFKIKVLIQLKNCSNKLVYTSEEGGSRLKDFKKGFQEAIRNAHSSMKDFTYEALTNNIVIEVEKDIVVKNSISVQEVKANNKVQAVTFVEKAVQVVSTNNIEVINTLYAQPIENGFQLINLKPQVVFVILNTRVKGSYIIKDKNGLLFKKGENWVAEFYEEDKLVVKEYIIKF